VTETLLEVRDLCKNFGGVVATNAIDLSVRHGEVYALIGPNGAGKTTLISQLSGLLPPDTGHIRFRGRDITGWPMHAVVRQGLARSFQITSIFSAMTVHENAALAVQATRGHSFRFWRPAVLLSDIRDRAAATLEQVGLGERLRDHAYELSHGERRQLEIAMALCTDPQLLLLDEPMAGMGPQESQQMLELLRALKGQMTILLVEHDMDAVFALADRISVLVYGSIIATGSPAEIRANAGVRAAYLGDDDSA